MNLCEFKSALKKLILLQKHLKLVDALLKIDSFASLPFTFGGCATFALCLRLKLLSNLRISNDLVLMVLCMMQIGRLEVKINLVRYCN